MVNIASALFQPKSEIAMEYTQEVMARAQELARSQLEVTENMYGEVIREYRELLSLTDPSAIYQSWPKVVECTLRNTAEGSAVILKNGINFQQELMQMMQARLPEINQLIVDRLIETTQAATTSAVAAAGRAAAQNNGGRSPAARASKAA